MRLLLVKRGPTLGGMGGLEAGPRRPAIGGEGRPADSSVDHAREFLVAAAPGDEATDNVAPCGLAPKPGRTDRM
ncbi:hypothetical protein SE92_29495 [Bradyrhizobium sp. AT1]|nr:hypothetical protein SE92_29495 [Bradyrhizobium sp. AT1]